MPTTYRLKAMTPRVWVYLAEMLLNRERKGKYSAAACDTVSHFGFLWLNYPETASKPGTQPNLAYRKQVSFNTEKNRRAWNESEQVTN